MNGADNNIDDDGYDEDDDWTMTMMMIVFDNEF
jgi:hypothetical protein